MVTIGLAGFVMGEGRGEALGQWTLIKVLLNDGQPCGLLETIGRAFKEWSRRKTLTPVDEYPMGRLRATAETTASPFAIDHSHSRSLPLLHASLSASSHLIVSSSKPATCDPPSQSLFATLRTQVERTTHHIFPSHYVNDTQGSQEYVESENWSPL